VVGAAAGIQDVAGGLQEAAAIQEGLEWQYQHDVIGVPHIGHSATIVRCCHQGTLRGSVYDIFLNQALCVVLLDQASLSISLIVIFAD
jgi:hypothetical protein